MCSRMHSTPTGKIHVLKDVFRKMTAAVSEFSNGKVHSSVMCPCFVYKSHYSALHNALHIVCVLIVFAIRVTTILKGPSCMENQEQNVSFSIVRHPSYFEFGERGAFTAAVLWV